MDVIPKEMLDLIQKQENEISFLEELFEDDCKCGCAHSAPWSRIVKCSVKAEYRAVPQCGAEAALWCRNLAMAHQRDSDSTCIRCSRLTSKCWTVLPI